MTASEPRAMEGPHDMRQPYTCIFRSTLHSRLWQLSPQSRCVWLWLRLVADPEGFVTADLTGVAAGANVTLDEAKRALAGFEQPDPNADPGDPYQGRLIERVAGGWLVLGIDELLELVRKETKKARTRHYTRAWRANKAANDTTHGDPESSPSVTVTPSRTKTKTKTKTKTREEISPLPPTVQYVAVEYEELEPLPPGLLAATKPVGPAVGMPVALHQLPEDWAPSEELRAEATMAGVTDLDERVASLRTGPIGGTRGVLPTQLDAYVRSFFGRWRAWAETDRAKARAASSARPGVSQGPSGARHTGWRGDDFAAQKYAERHGLDLHAIRLELIQSGAVDTCTHIEADKLLAKALKTAARNKGRAA